MNKFGVYYLILEYTTDNTRTWIIEEQKIFVTSIIRSRTFDVDLGKGETQADKNEMKDDGKSNEELCYNKQSLGYYLDRIIDKRWTELCPYKNIQHEGGSIAKGHDDIQKLSIGYAWTLLATDSYTQATLDSYSLNQELLIKLIRT